MSFTKKIVICLLLSAFAHGASSQLLQPYRFEREVKSTDDGFSIISLKSAGLALIRSLEKEDRGNKIWQLDVVDTTLIKQWSIDIPMESNLNLVGYEYAPANLFLLYREGDSDHYDFELATVDLGQRTYATKKVKFEVNFKMTHFTVSGSSAVFGGYVNNEPAILLYDASSDHPKVVPGLFIRDATLMDVRANQNQSFNVLLWEKLDKDKKRLVYRTYDHEGNLLIDEVIPIDARFNILTAITSSLVRDELIVVGTYTEGSLQAASGFFSVVIDPFNEPPVSYFDFPSISSFLHYMSPKRAEKIKTKATEQRVSGRQPEFKAHVIPQRIEERSKGFYVLAEVYYPSNNYSSYPQRGFDTPMYYGAPDYYYGSPFGYRRSTYPFSSVPRNTSVTMIETLVLSLDAAGHPKKDLSLKLDEIKLPGLDQVGDFTVHNDSTFIVAKDEDKIFYKTERADSIDSTEGNSVSIKLSDTDDIWKSEGESGAIRYWYDRNLYLWGYQNINNPARKGDQSRHVFYINRITVE